MHIQDTVQAFYLSEQHHGVHITHIAVLDSSELCEAEGILLHGSYTAVIHSVFTISAITRRPLWLLEALNLSRIGLQSCPVRL